MSCPIEDYGMIGDCQTAALVAKNGSVDWLCAPRFDSPACFAALLGNRDNGRWQICPADEPKAIRRRYLPGSLILETEYETGSGSVKMIDFMPIRGTAPDMVRTSGTTAPKSRMPASSCCRWSASSARLTRPCLERFA